MTNVTVPQAQPNDEITADLINRGSNAIAAVVNGNIDDSNVSGISGTKIAAGTMPVSALVTDQDDLMPADGWIPANESWTYVSATTFTVSGDQTSTYRSGLKLRYVQSSTTKYGEVASSSYSSPNTTVTIRSTSSTLTNAAISQNFISRVQTPSGFTGEWASWTPTWTNLTAGNGTLNYAKYEQVGKTVRFRIKFTLGSTSSVSGPIRFSAPVSLNSQYSSPDFISGDGVFVDTGTAGYVAWAVGVDSSTIELRPSGAAGSYVNTVQTSATIPHTWANTDVIQASGEYEAA